MRWHRYLPMLGASGALAACATTSVPEPIRSPASAVGPFESAAVTRLRTALPSESTPFDAPPGSDRHDQGWAAIAAVSPVRSPEEMDDIIDVLQAPLADRDRPIAESYNDRADGRVALATCKGNRRVIYYSASDLARFDSRTVRFVRQHELAHHRLGQVDCSGPQPRFPGHDERAADCAAVEAVRNDGLAARDMIIAVATVFYYVNKPAAPPYPSTRDRARYLEEGCGGPLPGS